MQGLQSEITCRNTEKGIILHSNSGVEQLVACKFHKLEVAGSNPASATRYTCIKYMDKERYLFLDFDGVLNTMEYQTALQWKGKPLKDKYGSLFDPYAVENLSLIIKHTAAKIVISSSWRLDGIKRMREMWSARGLPGEIYGVTPVLNHVCFNNLEGGDDTFSVIPYGTRGLEISEWLRIHPEKYNVPYEYAIVDDGNDFLSFQSEHIVFTEEDTGLTRDTVDRIIEILK